MKPFLLEGAWEANLSQSQRDPNHQFQQLTLHFEVSDEVVSLTFTGINKTGEPVSGTRKIHPDGKEYPVGEVPGVVEIARWVEPSIVSDHVKPYFSAHRRRPEKHTPKKSDRSGKRTDDNPQVLTTFVGITPLSREPSVSGVDIL